MSQQSIEQMMAAASQNSNLQQELERAEGFAEVVKIGAAQGYEFSEEELQLFFRKQQSNSENNDQDELTDEALEAVAGGFLENWRIRFGDQAPITIRQW